MVEKVALDKPFCRLLRFKRYTDDAENILGMKDQPTVLVVAPLSGHHATLLRDTVRTLLPDHKVYITDWVDARMVPKEAGAFTLDDYVAYIEEFIRHIGADRLHVISVCQPTVPVLAAVALMAARGEATPRSLVMMGGPIDTRESPTAVNTLATQKPLSWFSGNVHTQRARTIRPGACLSGFLHTRLVEMTPNALQSQWISTAAVQGSRRSVLAPPLLRQYNAVSHAARISRNHQVVFSSTADARRGTGRRARRSVAITGNGC